MKGEGGNKVVDQYLLLFINFGKLRDVELVTTCLIRPLLIGKKLSIGFTAELDSIA